MSYKVVFLLSISLSVLATIGCAGASVQSSTNNPDQSPKGAFEPRAECFPHANFSEIMKDLSAGDQMKVDEAKQALLAASNRSTTCRAQVITGLMNAMDKPDLNFERDADSYYLWRYGAELLGDLKATEGLDLLISHLDLHTRTFSSSMSHMPALRGVIKMGPIAIPKLDAVLKRNPDPNMRHATVYCIASIGGPSAVQSLREALPTESDKCVSRFIRISLDSFDNSGNIKDRGKWFSGVSCDQ